MNARIFPIAERKPNLSPQDCGFPRDVVKCVKRYRLPLLGADSSCFPIFTS